VVDVGARGGGFRAPMPRETRAPPPPPLAVHARVAPPPPCAMSARTSPGPPAVAGRPPPPPRGTAGTPPPPPPPVANVGKKPPPPPPRAPLSAPPEALVQKSKAKTASTRVETKAQTRGTVRKATASPSKTKAKEARNIVVRGDEDVAGTASPVRNTRQRKQYSETTEAKSIVKKAAKAVASPNKSNSPKPPPPKPPPPRPSKPPPPRPPRPPEGEPPVGFMETKHPLKKKPLPKPESSEDEDSEVEDGELPRLVALYMPPRNTQASTDDEEPGTPPFAKPAADVTEHELTGGGEFDSIDNLVRQREDIDETNGFNNVNSPHFKKRAAMSNVVSTSAPDEPISKLSDAYLTLLKNRKLPLVLDLDHTLLNSVFVPELRQSLYALQNAMKLLDVDVARAEKSGNALQRSVFHLPHLELLTKLRPGVRRFLESASQLFELHVNTMGSPAYAVHMVNLLDPNREWIKGTIKGLGELEDGVLIAPTEKSLDGPLRELKDACLIFDDTASVWASHRKNLITCERYLFFPQARKQFGLPGMSLLDVGQDESEEEGMLATAMRLMKSIHEHYFKCYLESGNKTPPKIQDILQQHRERVLAGVRIVFSRVFPLDCDPKQHPLWILAEDFGAECSTKFDDSTTHVIGMTLSTDKVKQARKRGCHCVTPQWLECSMLLWRRAQESVFAITRD